MRLVDEFKKFAVRGNVVDMAVGIVIGSAFTAVVNSLVADILTPPLGALVGNADFTDLFIVLKEGTTPGPFGTLAEAQAAGAVVIKYGMFLNKAISFTIMAAALFLLITAISRGMAKLKDVMDGEEEAAAAVPAEPPPPPTTKECPFCCSTISIRAVKCPQCTSVLEEAPTSEAPQPGGETGQ